MHRATLILSSLLTLAVPACAQWRGVSTRRADLRGGGGDRGKCTVEVEVDGAAEVEIRADIGRIMTLYGQPALWRRFVCSGPLPDRPAEFRFRGIDGRGRQTLLATPGRRSGAVVRIEDPQGGREAYTFDLEWRGRWNEGGWGNSWR
jgi:hypothetical protein